MSDSTPQALIQDLERMKFAITAAGIGVWELDLPTHSLIIDEQCSALLGCFGQKEIAVEQLLLSIHPADGAAFRTLMDAALAGHNNGSFDTSVRIKAADNKTRHIHFSGTAYFNEAGSLVRFGGVMRDLSSKEHLQPPGPQRELFSLFGESSVAIATIIRENLTFTSANAFYGELVGKDTDYLIGKPLLEALPELAGQGFDNLLNDVLNTGHPFVSEEVAVELLRNGKRETIYVNFTYQPMRDSDDVISAVLVIATDITQQVRARKQIEISETRFQHLIQDASVGIVLLMGDDMRAEMVNEAYCKLIGHPISEVLYRPIFDVIPDAESDFRAVIERVRSSEKTYHLYNSPYNIKTSDGKALSGFITVVYQPYLDPHTNETGVMVVVYDVTEQILAQKKVQESEDSLKLLSNSVPAMIFYLDEEQRYTSYNETFMHWYHVNATEVVGIPVREFIGEAAYSRIQPHLIEAYAGNQRRFEMPAPTRIGQHKWLSIVYTPDKQDDGKVKGIIVHATDVTESKRTEIALRESEARFRAIFEQAPMGLALMEGRDMIIMLGNDEMFQIWGKPSSVTGLPIMKALPELEGQPFIALMEQVYDTGIPHFGTGTLAKLVRNGVLEDAYFDFVYTPIRDDGGQITGIMTLAIEVTQRVIVNQVVARSEARFRSLIEQAPVATCLFTGKEQTIAIANETMLRVWGKDSSAIGKRLEDAVPELKGQPFLGILDDVFNTGIPYTATAARAELEVDGVLGTYYFNFTYKPLFNEEGEVYGIIDMAVDVTEQVLAHKELEEKEIFLNNAVELAELGTWSIDAISGQITYSQRLRNWLGEEHGVFSTQDSKYISPRDRERVRAALQNALKKGGPGYFDEVYTIVNVITGVSRIIHSSGRTQFDEEGNAVKLSGTAQDITMQHDLQTTLEQEVQMRTEELASAVEELQVTNEELANANEQLLRSNEELAQYAYVASHDLQEPLRKILVYTSILDNDKEMSKRSRDLVSKIGGSSERMRQLILGLLDFSRLLESDSVYQPVDLGNIVKDVFHDFELVAREKGATLKLSKLPRIEAVSLQMNQLFYNLVSNSLKFTKPGTPPIISVFVEALNEAEVREYIRTPFSFANYYKICISDNGIGFEKQYHDQIFEIFKRLHNREIYPGSGIGLALCRRIISNHNGALYTESTPGEGATFCLILPDRQSEENAGT